MKSGSPHDSAPLPGPVSRSTLTTACPWSPSPVPFSQRLRSGHREAGCATAGLKSPKDPPSSAGETPISPSHGLALLGLAHQRTHDTSRCLHPGRARGRQVFTGLLPGGGAGWAPVRSGGKSGRAPPSITPSSDRGTQGPHPPRLPSAETLPRGSLENDGAGAAASPGLGDKSSLPTADHVCCIS